MIGFAMCGSYCTHRQALVQLEQLVALGLEVQPIMSENVYSTDTLFGSCEELKRRVSDLCKRPIVHSIVGAEPLGPKMPLDALLICPCTGNTLAKIATGITDTAVTMAVKSTLRNDKPILIALSTFGTVRRSIYLTHPASLILKQR